MNDMGQTTKIEWCHHTFNPWRGCTKVSAGCANCYAESMSHRSPKSLGVWGNDGTRVIASESGWKEPERWDRAAGRDGVRRRVFCGSMCDVCEDMNEFVAPRIRLKRLIESTPNLDWLLLTKRPESYPFLFYGPRAWPENVWTGTSCENQETANTRIPYLLRIQPRIRFLSCEPLLGPINLSGALDGIDWVIVGGESGPNARPCNIEWVRAVVQCCAAVGVACFVKQLGSAAGLRDSKGGDPDEWPEDLRVRQFPAL